MSPTLPDRVRVHPASRLSGTLRLPGDKSISHRAVLLGALAEGTTTVHGLSDGDDVASTMGAVAALGARVARRGAVLEITGGRRRWHPPAGEIDCTNSGTTIRLLAGAVAACPWRTVLTGDASLRRRPMDRIAEPLGAMGARLEGSGARHEPPLVIDGGPLHAVTWTPPVASAQVKAAILLAGIQAQGSTVVREPVATRAHTEEMLADFGADVEVAPYGSGRQVTVRRCELRPQELEVPGDPSQAAFWVVAGAIVAGAEVSVTHLYSGPERLGFLGVLERMGAAVRRIPTGRTVSVSVSAGALEGTVVEAAEIPSLDEVPILAVAAAAAQGTTEFKDVGELRVKESDRMVAVAELVTALGARGEVRGDDLVVVGTGGTLRGGVVDAHGDHRIAMAAAVGALAAKGDTVVTDFASVATSYPGFLADLTTLAGDVWAPDDAADAGPRRRGVRITVDGPAGAGKSTVTRALSERLGLERLDTGAMYRALTWLVLARGVDPDDQEAVAGLARTCPVEVSATVVIDGIDVTEAIRGPAVNAAVSAVAANPGVRRVMVEAQRRWVAERNGAVVEGRDIASVVLPDAEVKVYLTATEEERARRRHEEGADGMARRDRLDSSRAASPLTVAEGARVIDTTGRSIQDVVEEILSWL